MRCRVCIAQRKCCYKSSNAWRCITGLPIGTMAYSRKDFFNNTAVRASNLVLYACLDCRWFGELRRFCGIKLRGRWLEHCGYGTGRNNFYFDFVLPPLWAFLVSWVEYHPWRIEMIHWIENSVGDKLIYWDVFHSHSLMPCWSEILESIRCTEKVHGTKDGLECLYVWREKDVDFQFLCSYGCECAILW
jgi:hypothetical protein